MVSVIKASYVQHCHNEMEVLYCIDGKFRIIIHDKEYTVGAGCVIFINSLEKHELIVENCNAEILLIEFGSLFLGEEFNDFSKYNFSNPLVDLKSDEKIGCHLSELFLKIHYEFKTQPIGAVWMIPAYLLELFATIVRYIPIDKSSLPKKQKSINVFLKIQGAFELIEEEYHQPLTLERAATLVGYETKTFCRLFKTATAMTFHGYLTAYRINMAMKLLEYKAYSIHEIGQMVGMPVAKTFSRVFKEIVRMSPREYRSMFK